MSQLLVLHEFKFKVTILCMKINIPYTVHLSLFIQSTITSVGTSSCNLFEEFCFGGSKCSFYYKVHD